MLIMYSVTHSSQQKKNLIWKITIACAYESPHISVALKKNSCSDSKLQFVFKLCTSIGTQGDLWNGKADKNEIKMQLKWPRSKFPYLSNEIFFNTKKKLFNMDWAILRMIMFNQNCLFVFCVIFITIIIHILNKMCARIRLNQVEDLLLPTLCKWIRNFDIVNGVLWLRWVFFYVSLEILYDLNRFLSINSFISFPWECLSIMSRKVAP